MSILVTRPEPEASKLVERLQRVGRNAFAFPLLETKPGPDLSMLPAVLQSMSEGDILVSVSPAASRFAGEYLLSIEAAWPETIDYYSIGRKTALVLHQYCAKQVTFPEFNAISETLLSLPNLQQVAEKNILILRGNGGRPMLGDTLHQRGAHVRYSECYQRVPVEYAGDVQAKRWRKLGISTLVVTSGEMLTLLYQLIPEVDRFNWLIHCRLIVVSQRLAELANSYGFREVIIAESADNDALFRALH